jgi:tetratricopeptide (TPR) repeat protein
VSDPKQPRHDPFEGLDWERELEDWDRSASAPGGAAVPESFSAAPPPGPAAPPTASRPADQDDQRSSSPGSPRRPLYRPPTPIGPRPEIPRPGRPLPSLLDDAEDAHLADTKGGRVISEDEDTHQGQEEDEGRTVVAPVSKDLLDQLEAAGFKYGRARRSEPPKEAHSPVPPPVDVDLLGMDAGGDESTAEHPAVEAEDPSVVTSAPDVVREMRRALGRSATDLRPEGRPRPADAPGAHGMFDPFSDLDVEPPASATLGPAATAGSTPRLLVPEKRRHNPEEDTAVLDRDSLLRPAAAEVRDPFASGDPFAAEAEGLVAGIAAEHSQGGLEEDDVVDLGEGSGLIDLLRGDEQSSDALPAYVPPPSDPAGERQAYEFLGDQGDAWRARAERIAADARSLDKQARARALVVAAEVAAIAGDRARAIEFAEEAWSTAPGDPLAIRQLRQLLVADGRWDDAAPLLESEAKQGPAIARAHAAIVAADAARLARAASEEASRLYELAHEAAPEDPRPAIARTVSAIANGRPAPKVAWSVPVLAESVTERLREGEPPQDLEISVLLDGLGAFAEGEEVDRALEQALENLCQSPTLGAGAAWLRVGLEAARASTRSRAVDRLAAVAAGRPSDEARLVLALDLGDLARAREAAAGLARDHAELATIMAHEAARALTREAPRADGLAAVASEPGVRPLGRALALANGEDPPAAFGVDDELDTAARLSRRLLVGTAIDQDLRARGPRAAQLGFTLADALGGGGPRATIEALSQLVAWDPSSADEPLARLLAATAEGDREGAISASREAIAADPSSAAAASALLDLGVDDAETSAIAAAEVAPDDGRGATLALRVALAALRRNDLETAKRAAELAIASSGNDPVGPFLLELRARRAGDFDGVVDAVRARAHVAADPVARAANLVREIFLLLGTDLGTCIERSHEAAALVPKDLTVRALYERIAGEGAQGRVEWRTEVAAGLEGAAKAETLLDAAREAERRGDLEAAERLATAAEAAGSGAEAEALRHRVQAFGDGASRLAEELLDAAKRAEDPSEQREIYEALADLDLFSRGDAASAILWHRAILDGSPGHLPSLRRLEHMLIAEGREDDYEGVASDLARVLPADGRDAHAEIAARLRLRRPGAVWESIADLVELAVERPDPSLWATRCLGAHARTRRDDATVLRAVDLLLARADRPSEVAALATRGAEAAFRTGDEARARAYLDRALEADPQHPTALASVAELRRHAGDWRGAAETIEIMASGQAVPEHRLEDWHAAAVLWLDRVGDLVRGRAALDNAAEIDLGYADVFERLVALARAAGEGQIVSDLYARRLAQVDEADARAQLLVDHARVLVELGDRDGARSAIDAALEAIPTHEGALEEGLRLAEEAEDWSQYESYLIRLSRAQTEPVAQIAVLRRLGALYEGPLPNPTRAEAVYRKILDHDENDDEIRARLVDVYVSLDDAEMAIETHQDRVRLAPDPPTRRARLIELAQLLDAVARDPDRALRALESARAMDPSDLDALTALAEFHGRHGRPDAVASALDAALADLRRRVAADPGDDATLRRMLEILGLRGRTDAVTVVRAALDGLGLSENDEPATLVGAEDAAAVDDLDELLCPAEITRELRAFLGRAGDALEKSVPVDLRALKAAKLGTTNPILKAKIDAVARGFGLPDPDVVISRAMPLLCLPVGAKPFQIVIGDGIVATDDEIARRFALARTMKLCSAHCASLVRVPPAELRTYLDALLHHLAPAHAPPAIEPERLDEITKRLQRFLPRKEEAELRRLAEELHAAGPLDVEIVAAAAATWGDRVALLATGDLSAALRGVAWSLGQKAIPRDPEARRSWLRETPAARDLILFAISDAHVEARRRAGVA